MRVAILAHATPFLNEIQTYDILSKHLIEYDSYGGYAVSHFRSRRGVGDKPMSCKPGVAGSISGFSQSVG